MLEQLKIFSENFVKGFIQGRRLPAPVERFVLAHLCGGMTPPGDLAKIARECIATLLLSEAGGNVRAKEEIAQGFAFHVGETGSLAEIARQALIELDRRAPNDADAREANADLLDLFVRNARHCKDLGTVTRSCVDELARRAYGDQHARDVLAELALEHKAPAPPPSPACPAAACCC